MASAPLSSISDGASVALSFWLSPQGRSDRPLEHAHAAMAADDSFDCADWFLVEGDALEVQFSFPFDRLALRSRDWQPPQARPADSAVRSRQVGTILVIEQVCGGLATAAQAIFIMRRCHPDHKAAHFAFATAIYSLAQTASGTYSGFLYEAHGPLVYFSVAAAAGIPCLLLIPLLRQQ